MVLKPPTGKMTRTLRIQTPSLGFRVSIPSEKNRNVGIIPFLGHIWILRVMQVGKIQVLLKKR